MKVALDKDLDAATVISILRDLGSMSYAISNTIEVYTDEIVPQKLCDIEFTQYKFTEEFKLRYKGLCSIFE